MWIVILLWFTHSVTALIGFIACALICTGQDVTVKKESPEMNDPLVKRVALNVNGDGTRTCTETSSGVQ